MPIQNINDKQRSDRGLLLQMAADGAHQKAYELEKWRIIVSLTLMVTAILASAWPTTATALSIIGAVWAVVSLLLVATASQRQTNTAAILQQQLDTWLFEMPWSSYAGEPLADEEVRRWSRKSTMQRVRMENWYPDVTDLPLAYAVLSCQRESLTWDRRLRDRFSTALSASASTWIVIGVTLGLVGDLSVRTIAIRWFVPSSAGLVIALQAARGHRQIASENEKWATLVRAELDAASSIVVSGASEADLTSKAAEIQQGLFALRKRRERVPRFLYEKYRDRDELDIRDTTADFRARLGL